MGTCLLLLKNRVKIRWKSTSMFTHTIRLWNQSNCDKSTLLSTNIFEIKLYSTLEKLGPVKRMRHSVRRVPYSICPHWTQLNSLICTQLECSEMTIGKYFWALTCMQSILSEKYRWARFVRDEGECVRCVDSLPECPADSCIGRRLTLVLSSPKLPYLANTRFRLGPSFSSI